MANEYSVNKSDLTIVADAIREKTETGSEIVFPSGFKSGIDEVFDAGMDALWDFIQNYGKRTTYENAFVDWAGAEYIRPKYKVVVDKYPLRTIFAYCKNLKKIEAEYFDFSGLVLSDTDYNSGNSKTYQGCTNLLEIEDVKLPAGCYYQTWKNCSSLKTIGGTIKFNEATLNTNPFQGCTSLENIVIEGTIGQSISFADCPLTVESAKSVLFHLKNFESKANPNWQKKTVIFSDETINELNGITIDPWETDLVTSPTSWTSFVKDIIGWLY